MSVSLHRDQASDSSGAAQRLVRLLLGVADMALRLAYVRDMLVREPVRALAGVLQVVAARSEQGCADAREAMVALVPSLHHAHCVQVIEQLRAEARAMHYDALNRVIGEPGVTSSSPIDLPEVDGQEIDFDAWRNNAKCNESGRFLDDQRRVAASHAVSAAAASGRIQKKRSVAARTLTLGERKALARRATRLQIARFLADGDPSVVRLALANSAVIESDVVAAAALRPAAARSLLEIAHSPRWGHRSSVRWALVSNPSFPALFGVALAALLTSHELRELATAAYASDVLRERCAAHLAARGGQRVVGSAW